MAEINIPQNGGRHRTRAPRIDLTPMVDLGFLLITFFMFTTTLADARRMEIQMPSNEKTPHPTEIIAESTITLIAAANHKVVYYPGILSRPEQLRICSMQEIRGILAAKKKEVANLPATFSPSAHKMYVLIKPDTSSRYADLVSLLDEMLIADAPWYAIVDITGEEREWVAKKF